MKTTRILAAAALALAAGAACAQATIDHNKALAGNVTPGDTPGYPITISQPGHYKLMGNLTVPAGAAAIDIAAPHVTIDLNGFTVAGTNACTRDDSKVVHCTSGSPSGIRSVSDSVQHIVVRNGTVRGFMSGISLHLNSTTNVVENVVATHNRASGVAAGGRIDGVVATMNGASGVHGRGLVIRSVASANGVTGIAGSHGVQELLVVDSVSRDNRYYGIDAATVRGTMQYGNGQMGRSSVRSAGGNSDDAGVY